MDRESAPRHRWAATDAQGELPGPPRPLLDRGGLNGNPIHQRHSFAGQECQDWEGPQLSPSAQHAAVQQFLIALQQLFASQTRVVLEDDLYFQNAFGMPHVKTCCDRQAIFYIFYRHGLVLERMLEIVPATRWRTILEIGAGWGGFAALARRKLDPRSRYIILDIPHSILIQVNFLRSVGYTELIVYRPSLGSLSSIIRCASFQFLFILPQHIDFLDAASIDLVFNMDSFVEMPESTINMYIRQVARASTALFTLNKQYMNYGQLQGAINRWLVQGGGFKLEHQAPHRGIKGFGTWPFSIGLSMGYQEQFFVKA